MDINLLISKIRSDLLSDDELIQCLSIPHNVIQNYAIQKIVEKRIATKETLEKLSHLSTLRDLSKNKLFSYYALGHIAIAALHEIGTNEFLDQYEVLYSSLSDWDKEVVEKLIVHKAFKK